MPAMLRSDKANKIAWKILGKPDNIAEKKTPKQKELDQVLLAQWTQRAR